MMGVMLRVPVTQQYLNKTDLYRTGRLENIA